MRFVNSVAVLSIASAIVAVPNVNKRYMAAENGTLAATIALTESLEPGAWLSHDVQMPLLGRQYHADLAATSGSPWNSWGYTGSQAVLSAWNSAAYDDADNRLFLMGGGHADYGGNEVYTFDFDTLEWTRLTDPAPLLVPDADPYDDTPVYLPDDSPPSPHTYDGLTWNPVSGTLWLTTHRAFNYGNTHNPSTKAVWSFDPASLTWTAHAAESNHGYTSSTFLPSTGQVLSVSGTSGGPGNDARLIDADGTVHELGDVSGAPNSLTSTMFVDPGTGAIYEAHAEGIFRLSIQGDSISSTRVATYPDATAAGFHQGGYAYNPVDGKFYAWNGGPRVLTWDPDSGDFELLWNDLSAEQPGDNALAVGRVFERWTYLEEAGVFAGVQSDGEVWFYRPGPNSPDIDKANVGSPVIDPSTAHTLNFYMPLLSGDRDYDSSVEVYYRELGAGDWSQALDLLRVRPDLVTISRGIAETGEGYAGSVFGLAPDTTYEVRFEVADPDGLGGPSSLTVTATTSALPQALPADPSSLVVDDVAGLQQALAGAAAGDVILLQPGVYTGNFTIAASGTALNPIVVRGVDQAHSVIDGADAGTILTITGDHVHVENLTLQNAGVGVAVRGGTDGVQLAQNRIADVSTGLDARTGHTNLRIVDNVLEGRVEFPDISNATWNYEGIVVTGQGIEVAHNTLSGFGDAIGMSHLSGGLSNVAIDIHHNLVLWGGDDGIELDFALRNVQAHHNLIANTSSGISFQPVWGGPAYAFQNVIYNSASGPYKIKPELDSPSGILILNNTSIRSGEMWVNFSGNPSNLSIVNNLFVGQGDSNYALLNESRNRLVEIDHNGWSRDGLFRFVTADTAVPDNAASFAAWRASTPFAEHGVLLDGAEVFATLELDFATNPFTVFRDPGSADFTLAATSPAVDAARLLPGINDAYTGAAPDIGALERGLPLPEYGARVNIAPATRPFANADTVTVVIDTTTAIDVLANDFDPNGDALTVSGIADVVNGSAVVNADGTVSFTPSAGYLGAASLTYTVVDPDGNAAQAVVSITVAPPNNAPTANDDSANAIAGRPLDLSAASLLANDIDPDGDTLTVVAAGGASHGTAAVGQGGVTYTPVPGFFGTDAFTYSVADGRGGSATATVTVTVFPDGTVVGTNDADHIDLSALADGQIVTAGGGGDVVIGSAGADSISGDGGDDTLDGGGGDDVFRTNGAGGGFDRIEGGPGHDTWQGGAGDDVFGVRGRIGGIERIAGGGGHDVIRGHDGRDTIDLSTVSVEGIAMIEGGGGPDFIIGAAGDDVIIGGADVDVLHGGPGDDHFLVAGDDAHFDTIDGGDGHDVWLGGPGDDVFGVWGRIDGIEVIDGNGGYDVILGGSSSDVIDLSHVVLHGIARIDGGGDHDVILGSAGDDVFGASAGDDSIDGNGGHDRLDVRQHAFDAFTLTSGSSGALVVDHVGGTLGRDTLVDVEVLEFSDGRYDVASGVFSPYNTAPTAHSDGFLVAAGTSTMLAVLDNDVDPDGDAIVIHDLSNAGFGAVGITADGRIEYTPVAGFAGTDGFRYAIADIHGLVSNYVDVVIEVLPAVVRGTAGADVLDFSASGGPLAIEGLAGPDLIIGTDGADVLDGGAGHDRIFGGAGDDVIRIAGADVHRDSVDGGAGYDIWVGSGGDDVFGIWVSVKGVERFDGGGGYDVIRGHHGRDILDFSGTELIGIAAIEGGDGPDIITGSAGDDVIVGGRDTDYLYGIDGDDTFLVSGAGNGFDAIDGGAGFDAVVGGDGDDVIGIFYRLLGIEAIDGGAGYDVVRGHAGTDVLDLSAVFVQGIELIDGGNGHDTVIGSAGADVISGGAGSDAVYGGEGADRLHFDAADIVLDGGAGDDTLLLAPGTVLDLGLASLSRLEHVDMANDAPGDSLTLRLADVLDLSDTGHLRISGDAGDEVLLLGEAHLLGTSASGGIDYLSYAATPGGAALLDIAEGVNLHMVV